MAVRIVVVQPGTSAEEVCRNLAILRPFSYVPHLESARLLAAIDAALCPTIVVFSQEAETLRVLEGLAQERAISLVKS
ncbi:MAG: hypothetical protein KDD53_03130 [Bdellovibrionales bacterium]|nr:hypothetical protein [Bdellovibrionales bacterium]